MASVLENMKRTSEKLFSAYNEWNVDAMMSVRSKDCQNGALPLTFAKTIDCVAEDNETHRKRLEGINPILRDFKFTAQSTIHDPEVRKSCFHMTSSARSLVGPYENEYTFLVEYNETGEEVTKLSEFVDSAYTEAYFAKLEKLLGEHGGDVEAAWKAAESG